MLCSSPLNTFFLLCAGFAASLTAHATEYHVATDGDDQNPGTEDRPFRSIMAAAQVAQPGDTITVHEGTYRERIDPPRGGTGPDARITYRAAPGAEVFIKGSERAYGWEHVQNDTWKVIIPNEEFGDFNPYNDVLYGDWYLDRGRDHHTGAVYLDGHWLTEAAALGEVLAPAGTLPSWANRDPGGYLLNLATIQPGGPDDSLPAVRASTFTSQNDLRSDKDPDGQPIIGWISDGSWAKYEGIDFGEGRETLTLQAASGSTGGIVEVRMDDAYGEILGATAIPGTGSWTSYKTFTMPVRKIQGVRNIALVFKTQGGGSEVGPLWYAEVDDENTTIHAQFPGVDPNQAMVEINARQSVFYPSRPGIDYIAVQGFKLLHAATPWAPPTAEQIGLIGTHWSKGWLIENNEIAYSVCTGLTLGKYGDEYDNIAATAEAYVDSIKRAYEEMNWNREHVGSHIVRNNHIHHCEMAGIVGSMGSAFSEITGNVIHDIHVRMHFSGAEFSAIKFHGPVDTLIADNIIFNNGRGMWLDWMTQGTRVTGNLFANHPSGDVLFEVNHGPFLVDNNIFLSGASILDMSQGGAYVNNFVFGEVRWMQVTDDRVVNLLAPHSTTTLDIHPIRGGDSRYYNNIFVNGGLAGYDRAGQPIFAANNVYLGSTPPSRQEKDVHRFPDFKTDTEWSVEDDAIELSFRLPEAVAELRVPIIDSEALGAVQLSGHPYLDTDGGSLRIDRDFFGKARGTGPIAPGPFSHLTVGENTFRIPLDRGERKPAR